MQTPPSNTQDYFHDAFYDMFEDDVTLAINSWSPTQIIGTNNDTGFVTTFTGAGFCNPDISLTGTVTGFSTVTGSGNPVAVITGIS